MEEMQKAENGHWLENHAMIDYREEVVGGEEVVEGEEVEVEVEVAEVEQSPFAVGLATESYLEIPLLLMVLYMEGKICESLLQGQLEIDGTF